MAIFKSAKVSQLESEVETLKTENAQLKVDLEAANGKAEAGSEAAGELEALKTENAALKEANAEIEGLNSTITEQASQIKDLTEKAVFTETKVSEAAAVKLAAMGHGETVDLTGEDQTKTSDAKIKGLTGLAKVTAAFQASKK